MFSKASVSHIKRVTISLMNNLEKKEDNELIRYRILVEMVKNNNSLSTEQHQELQSLSSKLHLPNPLEQVNVEDNKSDFLETAREHYEEDIRETTKKGWISTFINAAEILGGALILAFIINSFIFQPYEVVGISMQPTLENGDRLIVSKIGHTWSRITKKDYIPKRGDVIVLKGGVLSRSDEKENQLVKRVVGLPGDKVVIKDKKITIYNQDNPDGFNPDMDFFRKNLSTEKSSDIDTWEVKESEVFVVGDNRSNSLDSRVIGTVQSDHIVGSVEIRLLPLSDARFF